MKAIPWVTERETSVPGFGAVPGEVETGSGSEPVSEEEGGVDLWSDGSGEEFWAEEELWEWDPDSSGSDPCP